jgi:hypothetical protein
MAFALQLKDSLRLRDSQIPFEFANGDTLAVVLTRYLLAVEATADSDMLTSILLLDGKRLRHGAAPNLPPAYCAAIDNLEIGPNVGSCGAAAHRGHAIYVTDIASDPLWIDFRDLARQHGLRACWSTPIFDEQRAVIGTFAIYHLTPRAPTRDEVEALQTITDHVARAILWSNDATNASGLQTGVAASLKPVLKLVTDNEPRRGGRASAHEAGRADKVSMALVGQDQDSPHDTLRDIARDFEAITRAIEHTMDALAVDDQCSEDIERLRRAREATEKGAALARSALPPGIQG